MSLEKDTILSHCPLCGKNNFCGNLSPNNNGEACWCMDSSLRFSDDLLSRVSTADKNKVCICKACALSHKTELGRSV